MAERDRSSGSASGAVVRSLRDVRVDRLLTIRELAGLAGVARTTIYLTEVGRTTPRSSVIRRLCAALGVDPDDVAEFRRAIRAHAGLH